MASSFTPSVAVDMSKEREWASSLGMLDWDNTRIVFTKRSLIEFLKYTGVTVDPNFTNIQKLPRYAHFGTLSSAGNDLDSEEPIPSVPALPESGQTFFKPSRRVRTVPGGAHTDIFGAGPGVDDVLATAPSLPKNKMEATTSEAPREESTTAAVAVETVTESRLPESRPKSKRTTSSVASLWDAPDDADQFKPTRRVREMPGGKDNISELF